VRTVLAQHLEHHSRVVPIRQAEDVRACRKRRSWNGHWLTEGHVAEFIHRSNVEGLHMRPQRWNTQPKSTREHDGSYVAPHRSTSLSMIVLLLTMNWCNGGARWGGTVPAVW